MYRLNAFRDLHPTDPFPPAPGFTAPRLAGGKAFRGFPAAFEAQVRARPAAVAAVFEGEPLSYAELNARANRLARHMASLGLRQGARVGICLDRSLDMLVAVVAALKAGTPYVPLDPGYPAHRIAMMIEDAGLPLVVTDSTQPQHFFTAMPHVVRLDTDRDAIAAQAADDPAVPLDGADIAYVLYTSGSTGRPKGVEIPHGALISFLNAMTEAPGLTPDDAIACITTISFDLSVMDLLLPLVTGARTVIASRIQSIDGERLAQLIAESCATFLQATPATWRLLIGAGWQGLPGLRAVAGGEAVTRDLAEALLARCAEVWNLYGPTEATVWTTAHRITSGTGPVPIGRPIRGTYVRILEAAPDGSLRPVAPGEVGEIFIGGAGLARGYLDRPDLTAERFVPDPQAETPGARLYRTGDLGRENAEGLLECLGRVDHQVKIRGHRIELGEVEAAVLEHPGVHAAAAAARPDSTGDPELVAYLVPPPDAADALSERDLVRDLRRHLEATQPPQVIPTKFMVLDALPLTPNGKVDRNALPDPTDLIRRGLAADGPAPRTPLERELTTIWEEVLQLEGLGIRHDFFEIGGHSLLVARIFARIEAAFGCSLPMATIFEARTIEALAARIEAARGTAGGDLSPSLVRFRDGRGTPLFLAIAMDEDDEIYLNLSRHIDDGRPVIGIRATDASGTPVLFSRIDAMAAWFIDRLREVQPEGPYLLGGQCAGGVIAFEMARQLRAAGHAVPLVALMDVADTRARPRGDASRPSRTEGARTRVIDGAIWLNHRLEASGITPPRLLATRRSLRDPSRLLDHAIRHHVAGGVFDGTVLLLRATRGDGRRSDVPHVERYEDPLLGWKPRVCEGGLQVHDVPGGHGSMLEEPHAASSAAIIRDAIARALAPAETAALPAR